MELDGLVEYRKDSVVSKSLVTSKKGTVTVYAVDIRMGEPAFQIGERGSGTEVSAVYPECWVTTGNFAVALVQKPLCLFSFSRVGLRGVRTGSQPGEVSSQVFGFVGLTAVFPKVFSIFVEGLELVQIQSPRPS